ncbi:MAG: hypothetical protein IJC98_00175 [Clostridia bacterium]|nr:hypothetical protein [Clostridia bacterium]
MKTKRTLAWLLTLLTIGSTLIACGGDGDGGKETDGKGSPNGEQTSGVDTIDTANMTETQKRQLVDDGIETVDYNERPFRISGETSYSENHYYVESENGDPCIDAVWKRNHKIEERFNILIQLTEDIDFEESVLTDQKEVDLRAQAAWKMHHLVTQSLIYDWNDVEVINQDQPWYTKLSNDESTIMGTLYGICSDFSLSAMTEAYGIFFNTRLVENYGIDKAGLYDMVNKGTWTIDKLIEVTKGIYDDVNQDNVRNQEDLYGFSYFVSNAADVWLTAFDQTLTSKADDGTLVFNVATDKTEAALSKLRDWHQTNGVWLCEGEEDEYGLFVDAMTVFAPIPFSQCFTTLREMEDVYSVLPYPKWDENQTGYYTNANDNYQLFCLPKTLNDEDLEFVGSIFEVLSAETWKTVSPIYYDAALKGRYSKEPETAKMIDIIMNGRRFEFSFQYAESHLGRVSYLFRDLLDEPKTPLASKWMTTERVINAKVTNGFYDLFTE